MFVAPLSFANDADDNADFHAQRPNGDCKQES